MRIMACAPARMITHCLVTLLAGSAALPPQMLWLWPPRTAASAKMATHPRQAHLHKAATWCAKNVQQAHMQGRATWLAPGAQQAASAVLPQAPASYALETSTSSFFYVTKSRPTVQRRTASAQRCLALVCHPASLSTPTTSA